MALPYATPDQLNQLLKKIEKEIGSGGETPINVPTKLSQLENDTGFITSTALEGYVLEESLPDFAAYALKSELPDLSLYALKTELPDVSSFITSAVLSGYALKTELPDVSNFATKEEVEKIAVKEEGAAIQVGDEEHELNIKTNGRFTVNSAHEVVTYDPYPGDSTRKILPLENNDSISGKKTTGDGVPLIFMSKWDKVEVGGNEAPLNLNGSAERVTYKDDN